MHRVRWLLALSFLAVSLAGCNVWMGSFTVPSQAWAGHLFEVYATASTDEAGAAGPAAAAAVELVRKLFALSDDTTAPPAAETPGAGQPDDKATRSKQGAGGGK